MPVRVVLPVVGGQVTAVGSDSITVDQKGGDSATIHVSDGTTYDVNGNSSAKLSDVTVGSFVVAEGTQRSDGSLDASAVHAGMRGGRDGGGMGPMFRGGPERSRQSRGNAERISQHLLKRQLTLGRRQERGAVAFGPAPRS